jgi:hypothetical protein
MSVLLRFDCSSIGCIFDCEQRRCLSTAGVVTSLCGPGVNSRTVRSPRAQREDKGHIIGLDKKPLYH